MMASALKLACASLATLGPFVAGTMFQCALTQQSAALVLFAGICTGLGGLGGYCAFEVAEEARHQRNRSGKVG